MGSFFLSTSALVNMALDGDRGEQMKNLLCLFFSFVPIFVLAFALIPIVVEYGVGPLFLSLVAIEVIMVCFWCKASCYYNRTDYYDDEQTENTEEHNNLGLRNPQSNQIFPQPPSYPPPPSNAQPSMAP